MESSVSLINSSETFEIHSETQSEKIKIQNQKYIFELFPKNRDTMSADAEHCSELIIPALLRNHSENFKSS